MSEPRPRLSEIYQSVNTILSHEAKNDPSPAIFLKLEIDDGLLNESSLKEMMLGSFTGVSNRFPQPFLIHGDSLTSDGDIVVCSGWSLADQKTENDAQSNSEYALGMIRRSAHLQHQLKSSTRMAILPNVVKDSLIIRALFKNRKFLCGSQLEIIGTIIPTDVEELFSKTIIDLLSKILISDSVSFSSCTMDFAFTFSVDANQQNPSEISVSIKTSQLVSVGRLSVEGTLFQSIPVDLCESILFKKKLSGPVIAIGDVHGELGDLKELFLKIDNHIKDKQTSGEWTESQPHIIFVGDYVDRGPEVKKTIQFLIDLKEKRTPGTTHFIHGNHDFAFTAFAGLLPVPHGWDMRCQKKTYAGFELWGNNRKSDRLVASGIHLQGLRYTPPGYDNYNAEETMRSYGVEMGDRKGLIRSLPESHKNFFRKLTLVLEHDDFLFVHGGLQCHSNTWKHYNEEQQLSILRNYDLSEPWNEPLQYRSWDNIPSSVCKRQVVGHVRVSSVKVEEHIVRLDTLNSLSAISLPDETILTSNSVDKW